MTELNRAGQENSLGHIDTTQKEFRNQIDNLTDMVRQLGGQPDIPNNPLNAPYVLYVDAYIGSDTFVSGDYNPAVDVGTFESKMRRISLQRLQCGYTSSRPFRTLSRAVIEAGIITSRDYLDLTPAPCGDLVTIVIASGVHTALNGPGDASVVDEWEDGFTPTDADLTAFSGSTGGIILPRGCSVVSLDLRKTIFRPDYVPPSEDEADDLSNRSAMFLVTGGCYLYGFTIMDKEGLAASHHLLAGFAFAGKTELDIFYSKIRTAFDGTGATGNIDPALAVSRSSEYFIVGARPRNPVEDTDTVRSSSPYVYNISLRSEYGLSGMIADGNEAAGFRSMVVAQYTGVSLQRDIRCWQKYNGSSWVAFTDYDDLIATSPNDVRPHPKRRSFHVRTSNDAVIQEVSVFCIGQSIHHLIESGSEITITNSNSNFGNCALLAEGFKAQAQIFDGPFTAQKISRSLDPFDKPPSIKKIFLGNLVSGQGNTSTTLEMVNELAVSVVDSNQPKILTDAEYSLKEDDYIWVENVAGPDYRAKLTASPWNAANRNEIKVKAKVETDNLDGNQNPSDAGIDTNKYQPLAGSRVYIRRLQDSRTVEERRTSIILAPSGNERLPLPDYVIQPVGARTTYSNDRICSVVGAEATASVNNGYKVELRYNTRPAGETSYNSATYYRQGDVVRQANKHWSAVQTVYDEAFTADQWNEMYVHMEEAYTPSGNYKNAQPLLIFNGDTVQAELTTTCGFSLTSPIVVAQIISSVDYQGVYQWLRNEGRSDGQAKADLLPQPVASREVNSFAGNLTVEMRRPSQCRTFGHAFEWAGFSNYTKALPQYQQTLSPNNKFSYYFTSDRGGKVYVSGFNEEGLRVSNRGLENLETGKVLDANEIGVPDRGIDFPTTFGDLTVTGNLILSGANVIDLMPGTTTKVGGGEIAAIGELRSARPATTDAELNAAGANFVTPEGLEYWKTLLTFAPILDDSSRRIFVKQDWSSLPSNAKAYPVFGGGTVDLTEIPNSKHFTKISQAYRSLPFGYSLPDGSQIEIYLLDEIHDEGLISSSNQVGAEDTTNKTLIMPFEWNVRDTQQVLTYRLASNYSLGSGYFRNVAFYAENTLSGPNSADARWLLEVEMPHHTAGDPRGVTVVGVNIQFTNMHVKLNKDTVDTVTSYNRIFIGALFSPYGQYARHNERPVLLIIELTGTGTYVNSDGSNDIRGYDIIAFGCREDSPLGYGACMCRTAVLPTDDEQKRLSTAYYRFINNTGASKTILFHMITSNSKIGVNGASYAGWTTNITWQLEGSQSWQYRLFGWGDAPFGLGGRDSPNANALFQGSGLSGQPWGGFRNLNTSTNLVNYTYTTGPFSQVNCQAPKWGIFGIHNGITLENSLIGGTGSNFYLQSDPSRYNIVIPETTTFLAEEPEELYSLTEDSIEEEYSS